MNQVMLNNLKQKSEQDGTNITLTLRQENLSVFRKIRFRGGMFSEAITVRKLCKKESLSDITD